jgi:rSAM/selenodomain-associated transferase 1
MNANPPNSSIPNAPTLVVFCRRPILGRGKSRIAAARGAATALALAEHLLATTLEDARDWPGLVIIAPSSAADADWAAGLLSRQCQVIPQFGENLGNRINAVDKAARDAGHTHLIYIGSDAPILDADYFARSRAALATHDVVLGPADDGGVTLMGASTAWPDLATLPWSTENLGHALEQISTEHGLTVCRLEKSYDIDLAADLPRLYDDLSGDARPARQRLRSWLTATQPFEPDQVPAGLMNEGKL